MTEAQAMVRKQEVVFRGRVFSATLDTILMPNGREVRMEVVRHPGSVVLVAMPAPDQVVLVRQYRYAIGAWIWELPAGSLEPGEEPEEAARRECHEEVGLIPTALERLALFYPTPGFCTEHMIFYRLTGLRTPSTVAALDEDEDLQPRVFGVDEARRLLRAGEICDMKTAVGLMLIA